MSEFEQTSQAPSGSGNAELQENVNSLRTLLSATLILLIVFSLMMNLFLLKQVSSLRAQTDSMEAAVNGFNTPRAVDYWNHLVAYARTHPEFAPVINQFYPALPQTLLGGAAAKQ
jgi:hypothetical protein